MDDDQYFKRMTDFVFEAGQLAAKTMGDGRVDLKKDNSVVTKADKDISKLAKEMLRDLTLTSRHLVIEEEDPDHGDYLKDDVLSQVPYLWLIDPIDGSRNYALGMPNFGISIGLLKNLEPHMGVVYFPLLNELFICDGKDAYFVKNAFTSGEKKIPIKPIDQKISSAAIFLCFDRFFKEFTWDHKDCRLMIQSCAAIDVCWPSIGHGCGSILRCSLWDFAGSWPIALKAGLQLRSYATGRVLDKVTADVFDNKKSPWKLKDFYIRSSERNFPILKEKIKIIA